SNLKNQFDPAADAIGLLLRHLKIIISEPESTEINHAKQDQPNEAVIKARPDKTGHKDGANNQHATHGGRSLLAAVQFGEAVNLGRSTNRLSQFQRDQDSNNEVSKDQREQECRHCRGNGPERDIKENIEPDEPIAQVMEEVHHGELATMDCGLRNASITCSVRARRLPLMRMRSPGAAATRPAAHSSSERPKTRPAAMASSAFCTICNPGTGNWARQRCAPSRIVKSVPLPL